MINILLLSDVSSSHTQKWANSLSQYDDLNIYVFGFSSASNNLFRNNIKIISSNIPRWISRKKDASYLKVFYLISFFKLKKLIKEINPHIIHAHYASSYGLLARLVSKKYFLSVWGNDVFIVPRKSFFHKMVLSSVLKKATRIFSTSEIMRNETSNYTINNIRVIPFGVDLKKFTARGKLSNNGFVIGTIKSLEPAYGIEKIIRSFELVLKTNKYPRIKLKIVGGGSLERDLKRLTEEMMISRYVEFIGRIPHHLVPEYHRQFDLEIFPSLIESFGVSVLEAMASEVPVIVSNIGGLPEIVENNVSGIVLQQNSVDELSQKIQLVLDDRNLAASLANHGRERVSKYYDWEQNLKDMYQEYTQYYNSVSK